MKTTPYVRLLVLLIGCCLPLLTLRAQEEDAGRPLQFGDWTINPILGVQAWATYTFDQKDYDTTLDDYVPVDNRLNFMLRRLRFGSTAQVGDRLFIKFLGAADFVAADQRSATVGGVNNGAFPNLQVWDIYARYKISPNSEALYVVGGFLRPPLGRESMSGAFGVSSFEKSFTQFYVRQQATGTGPGGVGGVYLGGLHSPTERVHLDYRGGVFNAQQGGITSGRSSSPLLVGRVSVAFGDPERPVWRYGLANPNSFGTRRTFAVAVNASNEGRTAAAEMSSSLGADFALSLHHFHAEGEYYRFSREPVAPGGSSDNYTSNLWMVRTGFNIDITPTGAATARYLEPSIMYWQFNGATSPADFSRARGASFFVGQDRVLDVGLNYHLVPNHVRLSLHYVRFGEDPGEVPGDSPLLGLGNFQPGIGGIQRGDFVGFEVILSR